MSPRSALDRRLYHGSGSTDRDSAPALSRIVTSETETSPNPTGSTATSSHRKDSGFATRTGSDEFARSDSEAVTSPLSGKAGSFTFTSPTATFSTRSSGGATRRSSASDFAGKVEDYTGRFLDKVTDLRPRFTRRQGKKQDRSEKKLAKRALGKPESTDVLDKPDTKKLRKFWDISDVAGAESEGPKVSITEFLCGEKAAAPASASAAAAAAAHFGIKQRAYSRLPSISESSREIVGSQPIFNMDSSRLAPGSRLLADQADKARRVKDAQEMYQTIVRNAERSNSSVPPYDFLELIGKGAFGRVYKCRDARTGDLVAVKINSIDEYDWARNLNVNHPRDDTITGFKKEVSILQVLKDNHAKNVNIIHEAFDLHSQLWIVADYCTGGSVRTLLRPFEENGRPKGLPEHFIIPIARELAVAIKSIHELQIIHRDIKCANVYVTEDGEIQLGDFGIVGVIEDSSAKRKTVVGTPHWMPREVLLYLHKDDQLVEGAGYGPEVDIWSYGATLYEMAVGAPPYYRVAQEKVASKIEEVGAPQLEDENYSAELRDLISFCMTVDPKARPDADAVLRHPAIANTSKKYPTGSLIKLIELFKLWEHGGGSRVSLWMPADSDPIRILNSEVEDDDQSNDGESLDGWNFSTSDDFDKRFSLLPAVQAGDLPNAETSDGAAVSHGLPPIDSQVLSIAERIKLEHSELRANRGEKSLARLYNPNDVTGYQTTPIEEPTAEPSDLPLRNFTSDAPTRESMIEIDLNEADINDTASSTFALNLSAMTEETIRPTGRKPDLDDSDDETYSYGQYGDSADKRATMEWTFPTASQPKRGTMDWTFQTAEPAQPDEPEVSMDLPPMGGVGDLAPGFRPQLKHTATEPMGHFRDFSHDMSSSTSSLARESVTSMIDLDMGLADPVERLHDPADIVRPSTASSAAGSTMTDMTSGDPFDLEEDPVQNEVDRNRFSYHKQWQSDGGRMKRQSFKTMQMHARGSSLSSTESEIGLPPTSHPRQQPSVGLDLRDALEMSLDDTNEWPNFDGFHSSPQHIQPLNDVPRLGEAGFPLESALRTNGITSAIPHGHPGIEPPGPEIEFPVLEPPHPDALLEHADPQLLEDEFSRNLDDLAFSLNSVAQALRQYAHIDDDDGSGAPTDDDGAFDSNIEGTEDDSANEYSAATTRRNKPRRFEMRSSPRIPETETFQ